MVCANCSVDAKQWFVWFLPPIPVESLNSLPSSNLWGQSNIPMWFQGAQTMNYQFRCKVKATVCQAVGEPGLNPALVMADNISANQLPWMFGGERGEFKVVGFSTHLNCKVSKAVYKALFPPMTFSNSKTALLTIQTVAFLLQPCSLD